MTRSTETRTAARALRWWIAHNLLELLAALLVPLALAFTWAGKHVCRASQHAEMRKEQAAATLRTRREHQSLKGTRP